MLCYLEELATLLRNGGWREEGINDIVQVSSTPLDLDNILFDNQVVLEGMLLKADSIFDNVSRLFHALLQYVSRCCYALCCARPSSWLFSIPCLQIHSAIPCLQRHFSVQKLFVQVLRVLLFKFQWYSLNQFSTSNKSVFCLEYVSLAGTTITEKRTPLLYYGASLDYECHSSVAEWFH